MSYALSQPSSTRRGGLLSLVIGLHIGVIFAIVAAIAILPQMMGMPLLVEFIQPAEAPRPRQAMPLAVLTKAQPDKQQNTPAPQIENTNSSLPTPASAVAAPEKPMTLQVSINANNELFIGSDKVDRSNPENRFRDAVAQDSNVEMNLKADRNTRYESVAEAMNTARRSGLSRKGFVTQP